MTQADVLRKVVEVVNAKEDVATRYSQADVKNIIVAYGETVLAAMKESTDDKERIILPGLGSFSKKVVKERKGVTSLGGKKTEWRVPEHRDLIFKVEENKRRIQ